MRSVRLDCGESTQAQRNSDQHGSRNNYYEPGYKHNILLDWLVKISLTWINSYTLAFRSRSALPMTLTDDSAMAAAAIIGDSKMPNAG